MHEDEEAKAQREHAAKVAVIESRKAAFAQSPAWFTIWDVTTKLMTIIFWLCFWSLIVQCDCKCLI